MGENLTSKVYHKDTGLPPQVLAMNKRDVTVCNISAHAKRASLTDSLGEINIPESFEFTPDDIIELEVISNGDLKFLVRLSHDYENDILIAILFKIKQGTNIIKTVWLNSKYDNHYTLDESKYATL